MTPDKLPEEIQEQIKQKAEDFANSHVNGRTQRDIWELVFKANRAGATAWAERAHGLVDALESLESLGWQNWQAQAIAEKALQQWKGGKGKEVSCG